MLFANLPAAGTFVPATPRMSPTKKGSKIHQVPFSSVLKPAGKPPPAGGSRFSRWHERGSVTHLPARACWGVSERDLIAPPALELSLWLLAPAKPQLFPRKIKSDGAGAMPARVARARPSGHQAALIWDASTGLCCATTKK